MRQRITSRRLLVVLAETILIVLAVGLSCYIRLGEWAWDILVHEHGLSKTLLIAVVVQASLYYADLYDLRSLADRRELFIRIVQALGAASFVLAAIYFWLPDMIIGRGVFMV